jgi:hypothetical protein
LEPAQLAAYFVSASQFFDRECFDRYRGVQS